MTAALVTTLAVVAGIAWLAFLIVSALRNRGGVRVSPNLAPGTSDDRLETRRVETGQKVAIALSAFLAVGLPLYFLGEQDRQEGFVDQFHEESVVRGEHIVEEFRCFDCHGPLGSGGVIDYIEKRSGVTVSWAAPSLNDVLYRYDEDELNFWITFGRGNTPMPPWGLDGGGPMNESQVEDVVAYLASIQVSQPEAVAEIGNRVTVELGRLDSATGAVVGAILNQRQLIAEIEAAPDRADLAVSLAAEAAEILEGAGQGLDSDGDGVSDFAEAELSRISAEAVAAFTVVERVALDPANPQTVEGVDDLDTAEEALLALMAGARQAPILVPRADAVAAALEEGAIDPATGLTSGAASRLEELRDAASQQGVSVPGGALDAGSAEAVVIALEEAAAEEGASDEVGALATEAREVLDGGTDPDGDGLSTGAETAITNQITSAFEDTFPSQFQPVTLDPTNAESAGGQSDSRTASSFVNGLNSYATSVSVTANNLEPLLASARAGLAFLEDAQAAMAWEIDIDGVAAAAFDGDTDLARWAVGLFQANCARCHTAGFSAGIPFTQEAGSGGFGPALWDGRPVVQFGPAADNPDDDLLIQFLTRGSEAQAPYGLNGFGTGRMPGFGQLLTAEDIDLLARYLRGGNLDGKD